MVIDCYVQGASVADKLLKNLRIFLAKLPGRGLKYNEQAGKKKKLYIIFCRHHNLEAIHIIPALEIVRCLFNAICYLLYWLFLSERQGDYAEELRNSGDSTRPRR